MTVSKCPHTIPDFGIRVYVESGASSNGLRSGSYSTVSGSKRMCVRGFRKSCIFEDQIPAPGLMSTMSQPMCFWSVGFSRSRMSSMAHQREYDTIIGSLILTT